MTALAAIDTLPKGLKAFYKAHRLEMPVARARAGSFRPEGPERRFAVDRLMPFPFADLPRTETALKSVRRQGAGRRAGCPG